MILRNERGYRIGESHHRCRYSDELIEAMRKMRDEGLKIDAIAVAIGCSRSYVGDVVIYKRRAQVPDPTKSSNRD